MSIRTIASNSSTNQDTLVFSTLSDMAMFYDFSASYASNISTSAVFFQFKLELMQINIILI